MVGTIIGRIQRHGSGCKFDFNLLFGKWGRGRQQFSFTLETNGTLKTATIFDYETNASTYATIQVRDEYNATAERNFIVNLQTIYHPEKKLSVALLNDSYLNSYNRDLLYRDNLSFPFLHRTTRLNQEALKFTL